MFLQMQFLVGLVAVFLIWLNWAWLMPIFMLLKLLVWHLVNMMSFLFVGILVTCFGVFLTCINGNQLNSIQYFCDRLDFTRLCDLRMLCCFQCKMSGCQNVILKGCSSHFTVSNILKSCSLNTISNIMLISVCCHILWMMLYIVNLLLSVV